MARKKIEKVMAFLALFGIIIGIVGTGLLIIFGGGQTSNQNQELSAEEYLKLQELINSSSGIIDNSLPETNSGIIISTGTTSSSGEIK